MLIKRPMVNAVRQSISLAVSVFLKIGRNAYLFAFMLHMKADPDLQPSSPFP